MFSADTTVSGPRWPLPLELLLPLPVREFWSARLSRTGSAHRALARVIERREEARDTVTLLLRPNRHFRGFQPGQHVNVTVEVNGVRHTRSYSPSDRVRADGLVALTVRRVEGGLVSTALVRDTPVGSVLELGTAFGEMTWPQGKTDGDWLFAAAGSGITPLMSLLRDWAARRPGGRLTLLYWARTAADVCFAEELQNLATTVPGFTLQMLLTREAGADGQPAQRPDAGTLQRLVPDLASHRILACGPAGFVQAVEGVARDAGAVFRGEAFTPPALSVEVAGTVRVQLTTSGRTLEVPSGTPLLAALEAQGIKPAYGCRMGICNTCACGKAAGTSQNLLTGVRETEPETALRLCISRAVTDLSLDL